MTKFYLWRTQEVEDVEYQCVVANYETKNEAMMALRTFAVIIGKEVSFQEGTEFGDEPAIWAWSVTDISGGKYYVTAEEVDDFGNIIDSIF